MEQIIDCFTYNGEKEILDIRLNCLYPLVDKFIIVEAKTTFSGKEKDLYFSQQEILFKKFWKKIDYFIIDENYSKEERELAENSPNTKGAKHWKREFLQKESIKKALQYLDDDDRVYIGDVDEIWKPYHGPLAKLKLIVYAYKLNQRSSEDFWGPISGTWGEIKNKVLNHVRSDTSLRTPDYHGWHFTSMGGEEEVRRKLNDSYTSESYNTDMVQALLKSRLDNSLDYLGRNFSFWIDEDSWPEYLKEERSKYRSLLAPRNPEYENPKTRSLAPSARTVPSKNSPRKPPNLP